MASPLRLWRGWWLACALFLGLWSQGFAQVQINGVSYQNVPTIAKKFGLKAEWVTFGKTMRMKGTGVDITVTLNERHVTLNGNPLALGAAVVSSRGQLHIGDRDVLKTLQPLLQPQTFSPIPALRRIVIDAGHGGKDPGAANAAFGLVEKNLTLDVAKRLKSILEARGFQVFLTRSTDTALARTERTAISNRLKADLFISVHFNTVAQKEVTGVETWVMTPVWQVSTGRTTYHPSDRITRENNQFDTWNARSGYYICDSLAAQLGRPSRGLKRARFDVLTGLRAPAVLVECAFISNSADAKLVATPAYREKMALGIADGVGRYQRTLARITAAKATAK